MSRRSWFNLPLLLSFALAPGCLYTHVTTTLDEDLQETSLGSKRGESSSSGYGWLVWVGDAGMQAAAENGGITVLRHADRKRLAVLFGLYFKETTIVYGD